jgi:two-component system nitrogen regulation response regulator GlnG/two-component system response regulator HydG
VARNAATFPAGLVDAELFGHVANYPNAGMPQRPGLVGEADGSTLFLDEIGELPEDLQTHLLRVLDPGGEYQRLGEARSRSADRRLVAATNRPIDAIRHDLAARLALRVVVPSLNDRREDIPLIARHLLRRIAASDADIGERFFDGWTGREGEPRLSVPLVRALVAHDYTTHVRELEALLWSSLASSSDGTVELTPAVREELAAMSRASPGTDTRGVTAEMLRAAMERHQGVQEKVWRDLGFANRYVLKRLLKKHGMSPAGQ